MIYGIIGKIGSGKTTISEYLKLKGFLEYSFATPLKKVAIALGFSDSEIHGTQEEKLNVNKTWNISGREFLQKFGTEVCRNMLPDLFPVLKNNHLGIVV